MPNARETARQVVESLIREDDPLRPGDPAPEPTAKNPANGLSPDKLGDFVRRYFEGGAHGIEISAHYGDAVLEVVEVWESGGVVRISVAAQPDS